MRSGWGVPGRDSTAALRSGLPGPATIVQGYPLQAQSGLAAGRSGDPFFRLPPSCEARQVALRARMR
jgi:hypothetical protein